MDPNITLQEIREISRRIVKDYVDENSDGVDQDDAYNLAECIRILDEWLSKDGFLPKDWEIK